MRSWQLLCRGSAIHQADAGAELNSRTLATDAAINFMPAWYRDSGSCQLGALVSWGRLPAVKSRNFAHLPGLDHPRGMAAGLIMLYHGKQLFGHWLATGGEGFSPLQEWTFSLNPLMALVAEGHASVSLFIVLSGFVFTY